MKTRQDVIEHAASATGLGRPEVRRVLDAAFAFVRSSVLAGEDLGYPGLGRIRVRTRTTPGGGTKTIYRFDPGESTGAPGGGGKARRAGKGAGRRRRDAETPPGDAG